jgi:O-antigen biosynthesis protein WbqP
MFNRLAALIILLILSPIFLIVAMFIFLEDGLPVFFKQKRVGINYTFFHIYKFRSMKKNTPNVATHLLSNPEQYLLKIGGTIRKLSLDELPNLINIIRGEMVFVGPRPALYSQLDLIEARTALGVDTLLPGITGWAQVNGRDDIPMQTKVCLDAEYFQKKSLYFDLKILWLTSINVILGKGISH